MKRRTREAGAGSLDMLLDTMCNTFGGVCFIALLVAILSAMLPKDAGSDEADVRKMAEDEAVAELMRTRDQLRVAVDLQRDLLLAYETNATDTITAADISALSGDKDAEAAKLRRRILELEEQIKNAATATDYNEKEFARLMKLSDELKRKLADFKDARRRTVRTALERSRTGWHPIDVWLRNGKFHERLNSEQVSCVEKGFGADKEWHYQCIPGRGVLLDDRFLQSPLYRTFLDKIRGQTFVRIFSDKESFPALCRIRDDLVRRGYSYNWYHDESPILVFSVGSDDKIQ